MPGDDPAAVIRTVSPQTLGWSRLQPSKGSRFHSPSQKGHKELPGGCLG